MGVVTGSVLDCWGWGGFTGLQGDLAILAAWLRVDAVRDGYVGVSDVAPHENTSGNSVAN